MILILLCAFFVVFVLWTLTVEKRLAALIELASAIVDEMKDEEK
jgi:hypothetical protein